MKPAGDRGYNPIFERFVDSNEPAESQLAGIVAYSRYKHAKREWASGLDHKPTDEDLHRYLETWTESRIQGALVEAKAVIGAFAEEVVASARSGIREEALRGTFWKAVWPAMVAAALYTLALIAVVIILKLVGVDILSIASEMKKQGTEQQQSRPAAVGN